MPLTGGDDAALTGAAPAEAEHGAPARIAGAVAILGGLLSLAIALVVVVSVTLRSPLVGAAGVPGDFELVQMATAVSIFAFLPLTQARRANIVVDTFTLRLSRRVRARIDAFWDMVYAGVAALIAYSLIGGARDASSSGTNTMVLALPISPAIAACAILAAFLALVAAWTGVRVWRAGGAA